MKDQPVFVISKQVVINIVNEVIDSGKYSGLAYGNLSPEELLEYVNNLPPVEHTSKIAQQLHEFDTVKAIANANLALNAIIIKMKEHRCIKLGYHEWVRERFTSDPESTKKENEQRSAAEYKQYIGQAESPWPYEDWERC